MKCTHVHLYKYKYLRMYVSVVHACMYLGLVCVKFFQQKALHMYACVYACIFACIHWGNLIRVITHVCFLVFIHTHWKYYKDLYTCLYEYIYKCVCTHVCTNVCIFTWGNFMRIFMHVCIH
jgi:hypothetical protein